MKKHSIILVLLAIFSQSLLAQKKEVEWLNKGNNAFLDENYDDASVYFQNALEENSNYAFAMFNLGDALFLKGDYEKARDQFENAAITFENKIQKSASYYNLGLSYTMTAMELSKEMQENANSQTPNNAAGQEDAPDPYTYIEKGADAFKDALRNNPHDEDARYNLAYLQKILKQMPPPQQNQDQNKDQDDENKDKDQQDNKDQQDKKDGGDKGDEQKDNKDKEGDKNKDEGDGQNKKDQNEKQDKGDEKKDGDKKGDDKDSKGSKPEKLSKQQAEQILNAIDKNEKDLRKKMKLKKVKGNKIMIEKDW